MSDVPEAVERLNEFLDGYAMPNNWEVQVILAELKELQGRLDPLSSPCRGEGCDGDVSCDCYNNGWESAYDAAMYNGDDHDTNVDELRAEVERLQAENAEYTHEVERVVAPFPKEKIDEIVARLDSDAVELLRYKDRLFKRAVARSRRKNQRIHKLELKLARVAKGSGQR